ncbi:MAG: methyltransferase domain-containing protein [Spirochaetaceae bacterium]|nr:methyltransferase domain-containing protein [Spirochaetaceae bacterium]
MDSYKEQIAGYYDTNFEHTAANKADSLSVTRTENYKILGWESRAAQYKRFAVFTGSVIVHKSSILDVGCGLADLFHFITQGFGYNINYTGIDLSPKMIELAKEQLKNIPLPSNNSSVITLLCQDIFSTNPYSSDSFDFVYSSGIFNLNLGNNLEFLQQAFLLFASLCKKAFVCSLLSDTSDDKEDLYYYYNKDSVSRMLEKLKKTYPLSSFKIVDDYLINDFSIVWKKS